jgi:outer membrane protein OmpA-like peptidoglycan-associated protein
LSQRLVALDADARLQGMAAYERLRARQAVDALANVRKSARPHAVQVADARVTTAELAARTAATQREVDRLDRVRSDLLVEASRQDAERARQEAERLRMEAQVQAEEAERLRASIEAESTARQQAEDVILDVTGDQASKLAAAREKEAALARQEAELTAGASLPPSKRDARGEVFTLPGDAFASGGATLTGSAKTSLKALAAYLKAGPVPRVKIEAHDKTRRPRSAAPMRCAMPWRQAAFPSRRCSPTAWVNRLRSGTTAPPQGGRATAASRSSSRPNNALFSIA